MAYIDLVDRAEERDRTPKEARAGHGGVCVLPRSEGSDGWAEGLW